MGHTNTVEREMFVSKQARSGNSILSLQAVLTNLHKKVEIVGANPIGRIGTLAPSVSNLKKSFTKKSAENYQKRLTFLATEVILYI